MKVSQIKNFKMNDITYKKRRQVIDLIYEVKKEVAEVDAVRQIFGYMKARDIKDGIIAAQKISSKAQNLMKEYNDKHDVNIIFWDYTQLAIFN